MLFLSIRDLHPDLTSDLQSFRTHLKESNKELAELKVWQLQGMCQGLSNLYVIHLFEKQEFRSGARFRVGGVWRLATRRKINDSRIVIVLEQILGFSWEIAPLSEET